MFLRRKLRSWYEANSSFTTTTIYYVPLSCQLTAVRLESHLRFREHGRIESGYKRWAR